MNAEKQPVSLMIFDLDGTLIRSGDDIAASVNYTLDALSQPPIEREKILRFIGDGVRVLIERSLGPTARELVPKALELFSTHYADHMLDTTDLYPDVHPVLTHFARQNKVIVTNKPVGAARAIVDRLQIRGYFTEIIGADTTPHRKPDTGVLAPLFEGVAPDPKRTLVVGDGVNDILLARNAGFISCALLNGLSDREDLLALEPDHACERLSELVDLFA